MKKFVLSMLVFAAAAAFAADASSTDPVALPNWSAELRRDRPRLLINNDLLPKIRNHALSANRAEYDKLRAYAYAPINLEKLELRTDRFTYGEDGRIKLNPSINTANDIVLNTGVKPAAAAAMLYMISQDEADRDRALELVRQTAKYLRFCLEIEQPVDYHTEMFMNMIFAFDCMYDYLEPDERRAFAEDIAEYVREMQPEGRLKVFKATGDINTGFYGTYGMLFPAGIVLYDTGVDPALVDHFLDRGYDLAVRAMRYRDELARDGGLLGTATPSYSFGAYPLATHLFFLENRAALGRDVTLDYTHLQYFINWFLWATIPDEHGDFYHYGVGDASHNDNRLNANDSMLYGHFAQVVNFYKHTRPDAAERAKAVMDTMAPERQRFHSWHPFMPLLMTEFAPSVPSKYSIKELTRNDTGFYFTYYGLAIMRSEYSPLGTYAMFRTGSETDHHQHFDENSFVIYRNGFLALDTGNRCMTQHHTHYYPQTVAHNAILIEYPNEAMPYAWKTWPESRKREIEDPVQRYSDGGQSSRTLGKCRIFETTPQFTWTSGDATRSYRAEKCALAQREFVFLPPHVFVVYDRVESTSENYRKRWLLHVQNEPFKLNDSWFASDNGTGGILRWTTLLPQAAEIEIIGGPGKQFFASGRNWPLEAGDAALNRPNHFGAWRMEVSALGAKRSDFLHILHAAAPGEPEITAELVGNGARITLADGKVYTIEFNQDRPGGNLHINSPDGSEFTAEVKEQK